VHAGTHHVLSAILVCGLLGACGETGTIDFGVETENDTEGNPGGSATPECHPLDQDCPGGQICYASGDETGFRCGPAGGQELGFGEACVDGLDCLAGLACSFAEVVPNCADGFGCCTYVCELGADVCGGGLDCSSYFNDEPPPGFEDIGLCVPG
jgi:hypothetical protein